MSWPSAVPARALSQRRARFSASPSLATLSCAWRIPAFSRVDVPSGEVACTVRSPLLRVRLAFRRNVSVSSASQSALKIRSPDRPLLASCGPISTSAQASGRPVMVPAVARLLGCQRTGCQAMTAGATGLRGVALAAPAAARVTAGALSVAWPALVVSPPTLPLADGGCHFSVTGLRSASAQALVALKAPAAAALPWRLALPRAGSTSATLSCCTAACQLDAARVAAAVLRPPVAASCRFTWRWSSVARPCALSCAWLRRPASVSCTPWSCKRLGRALVSGLMGCAAAVAGVTAVAEVTAAAVAATALSWGRRTSSWGTLASRLMAGSRQPPVHWPVSSPLPVARAVCTLAGRPGRVRSQASKVAALVPRTCSSPLPVVALSAPCSLASRPGAVKASLPWPLVGWATSWPVSAASWVRTCSSDSVSVPPASAGFQLPLAMALCSCNAFLFLGAGPVVLSLTSNPMAGPTLCTAAAPFNGPGASVE